MLPLSNSLGLYCSRAVMIAGIQSLSEVVGTRVVLDCKFKVNCKSLQFFTHNTASPHPNQCCLNQNTSNLTRNGTQHEQGAGGGLTFVEIQRFCGMQGERSIKRMGGGGAPASRGTFGY
jgi:hypothetical protein